MCLNSFFKQFNFINVTCRRFLQFKNLSRVRINQDLLTHINKPVAKQPACSAHDYKYNNKKRAHFFSDKADKVFYFYIKREKNYSKMVPTTSPVPSQPQSWSQVVQSWSTSEFTAPPPEYVPCNFLNGSKPNSFFSSKLEALNPIVRYPTDVSLQTCARIFDQLEARHVIYDFFLARCNFIFL